MMPIKNPGRHCVQCCLSSFLFDNKIGKTPLQIICSNPVLCNVGSSEEGIIDDSNLVHFCSVIGLSLVRLPDGYKIQKSDEDGSLLIGLKWRENKKDIRHMIRFDRFNDNPSNLVVMDPNDLENDHTVISSSYFDGKTVIYYRLGLSNVA